MVIFERLARLLVAADGSGRIVEADDRWRIDQRIAGATEEVVVWGRPPLVSGAGLSSARRFARDRRRALGRLRQGTRSGLRIVDAVWWTPPAINTSRFRQTVKDALTAGAALTLSRAGRVERMVDRAWSDAGLEGRAFDPRASSGGSLRVDVDDRQIFRAGRADGVVDPRRAGRALVLLERSGVGRVPRLLRDGMSAAAGWTIETRLAGSRPAALTQRLVEEVVGLMSTLPREESPPRAFEDDVGAVLRYLPNERERVERLVSPQRDVIARLPSVLRHGDLWSGNLLESDGGLVGVVDWDATHVSGVPGVDLVHLLSGHLVRGSLGERFARAPWRDERFAAATEAYWLDLGIDPDPETLDAIGVAWWVGQIAANLDRLPHLAADRWWVATNVENVLRDA